MSNQYTYKLPFTEDQLISDYTSGMTQAEIAADPTKTYDWANLTGNYADIADYQRMCRSCHWKYDKKHSNLGNYAVKQEVAREKTNSR